MTNAIKSRGGWTHGAAVTPDADETPPVAAQGVRVSGGWRPADHSPPVALPPAEPVDVPAGDEVPTGRVDQVLAWVGDDRKRADRAWCAEVDGKRRRTLLTMLTYIADGDDL